MAPTPAITTRLPDRRASAAVVVIPRIRARF
jgi:hypothetical protein